MSTSNMIGGAIKLGLTLMGAMAISLMIIAIFAGITIGWVKALIFCIGLMLLFVLSIIIAFLFN
jgi:hypothetical protein